MKTQIGSSGEFPMPTLSGVSASAAPVMDDGIRYSSRALGVISRGNAFDS